MDNSHAGAADAQGNRRVDFAGALGKRKREVDEARDQTKYVSIKQIPAGSIRVESLFSTTKRIATWDRGRLLPRTLEMLVFLKQNRRFWNVDTMLQAINAPEMPGDDLEADLENAMEEAYDE